MMDQGQSTTRTSSMEDYQQAHQPVKSKVAILSPITPIFRGKEGSHKRNQGYINQCECELKKGQTVWST
jgi:hypothetical protein